jgi:hypothetical protein
VQAVIVITVNARVLSYLSQIQGNNPIAGLANESEIVSHEYKGEVLLSSEFLK